MQQTDEEFRALSAAYWEKIWLYWPRIGAPLRPGPEDVSIFERLVVEHCKPAPKALLLGVTPEIAGMRWPTGTQLLAVDRSQGMIDHVWPNPPLAGAQALRGDWGNLALPDGDRDLIIGDGSLMQQPFPSGYQLVARELRRVLAPGGVFVMRAFVRPDVVDAPEDVFAALRAGHIKGFHAFKWRLNMSLQPDTRTGVVLGDVWRAFHGAFPDLAEFTALTGWPREAVETIDAYRDGQARYTYPSLNELREVLSPYFSEARCLTGTYELSERCPTLLFAPR